jgi:single-strand DNA-binding protein
MKNKVNLIGRLGKDPEIRYTTDQKPICHFSLATSESWKDKSGERKTLTEWHNIVIFGKLAEIAAEHLKKGSLIDLEGKIKTRPWQDKDGKDRYTTEIITHELRMLSKKDGADSSDGHSSSNAHDDADFNPRPFDEGDIPF